MKQYLIDELRIEDYKKIKNYFDSNYKSSYINGVYYINIDENLLSLLQKKHNKCKPHYFTIVLEENSLFCELFIRVRKKVKCTCMGYANLEQRNWIIDKVDSILKKLEINI